MKKSSEDCSISSYICIKYIHIFTNASAQTGCNTGSFFLTGFNSEFSFSYTSCHTKGKEPCLPYYLPIARGRIVGFIPFLKILSLCEMKTALFRIWTWFTLSISYYSNHDTTSASKVYICPVGWREAVEYTNCTFAELFWQLNCVLMLNWIVWNRANYLDKNGFGFK